MTLCFDDTVQGRAPRVIYNNNGNFCKAPTLRLKALGDLPSFALLSEMILFNLSGTRHRQRYYHSSVTSTKTRGAGIAQW